MSRDTQIGLLLGVGFLALVGGVLYYRIEHPDDLDQFWNSPQQVAQATSPQTTSPESTDTPSSPAQSSPPPLATEVPGALPSRDREGAVTPTSASSPPPLAHARGSEGADIKFNVDPTLTGPLTTKPDAPKTEVKPTAPAPPALAMAPPKQEAPAKTETLPKVDDKPTTTRQSFPEVTATPPSTTLNPPAPPGLSLNLPPAPSLGNDSAKPKDDKPAETNKPTSAPAASSPLTQPTAPTPPLMSAPGLTSDTKPANPALSTSPPLLANDTATKPPDTTPPTTTPPSLNQPPPSKELPKPQDELKPSGVPTAPSNLVTELKPPPAATTPPTPAPTSSPVTDSPLNQPSAPPSKVSPDGRYREYTVPQATLGRPVPESVSAEQERRWAEGNGSPSPIVPSSNEVRGKATQGSPGAATIAAGSRRVVSDAYIPRERALAGETFSSLSQRLYGDTHYAAALAAYNRDEGFVENDQPTPNQWVAKPNREILDLKYPHLVRPSNRPAVAKAPGANPVSRGLVSTRTDPPAAVPVGDLPVYRVGKGEQLFEVAKKTLGDGYRWSEIYALNKDQLRDTTELRADMLLRLPSDAKLDAPKAR
jgi:hypothetical protein